MKKERKVRELFAKLFLSIGEILCDMCRSSFILKGSNLNETS